MKNIDILIKKIAERYDIEIIEGSNHHEVVKENGDVITPNEDSFLETQIWVSKYAKSSGKVKYLSSKFGIFSSPYEGLSFEKVRIITQISNSSFNKSSAKHKFLILSSFLNRNL